MVKKTIPQNSFRQGMAIPPARSASTDCSLLGSRLLQQLDDLRTTMFFCQFESRVSIRPRDLDVGSLRQKQADDLGVLQLRVGRPHEWRVTGEAGVSIR